MNKIQKIKYKIARKIGRLLISSMSNIDTNTKESNTEQEKFNKIYGGYNENKYPFNIGDKIRQKYTIDKNNNLVAGKEIYEFMGMQGNVMLLKTLNKAAAFGVDTIDNSIFPKNFNPLIGQIFPLHYIYADRFEVIK